MSKPNLQEQIEGLWRLYQAGAFLRLANPNKSLQGVMRGFEFETDEKGDSILYKDEFGAYRVKGVLKDRARTPWTHIESHVKRGGLVLIYEPGKVGLMVLDFDPMLEERLDTISALFDAEPYRVFESSGKYHEPAGSKPGGYGGHAVWRVMPERAKAAARIRQFSYEEDGEHYGEAFTGHEGFGVIVWNAPALADTMELDDAEAVDPTLLPKARYSLAVRMPDGSWDAGEGSRHDAAMSALSQAARACRSEGAFEEEIERIEEEFMASFDHDGGGRDLSGEWGRMVSKARDYWKSDRAAEREAAVAVAAAQAGGAFAHTGGSKPDTGAQEAPPAAMPSVPDDPVGTTLRLLETASNAPLVYSARDGGRREASENKFASWGDAADLCAARGIPVLRKDWRDDTLYEGYKCIGYEARWNSLIEALQIRRGGDWVTILGGDEGTAPLRVMRNAIGRECAYIACDPPSKAKGETQSSYRIARIPPTAWGNNGKALYGAMTGLTKTHVPVINPLVDWLDDRIAEVEALDEFERAEIVGRLKDAFLELPGLKPKDDTARRLGSHAGVYFYAMLAHRLIQWHPRFTPVNGRKVKVQREVPVLVGEPGLGKSTAVRHLMPDLPEGIGMVEVDDLAGELNPVFRRMAGQAVMFLDDLDSLKHRVSPGKIKTLITKAEITFDRKYLNDQTIPMPTAIIATANKVDLPDDDGAVLRFVPVIFERDRTGDRAGLNGEEVARLLQAHIEERKADWLRGGLILAIAGESIELPDDMRLYQLRSLADAATDADGVIGCVEEMIASGNYTDVQGDPAIAAWQVAHQMEWLRYPEDVGLVGTAGFRRQGSAIARDADVSLSMLSRAWASTSGSNGVKHQKHQITSAMRYLNWSKSSKTKASLGDKDDRVRDRVYRPNNTPIRREFDDIPFE